MTCPRIIFVGLVSVLCLLWAAPAAASVERYAVLIGNNSGAGDEEDLHFAESDASRLREVLVDVGAFAPENVSILHGKSANEVRRALITINDRIRRSSTQSVLLVYYSGHADSEALHLGNTRLPTTEIEKLVRGSSADVRLLILDSCRSGSLTRVKGGRRVAPQPIVMSERLDGSGVVFLTASAESEDAQESLELKGSFFTHFLISGLLGAADVNDDGAVSLSEAYRHAYDSTLRASSRTIAGSQHPTFRYDLAGKADIVLTRPSRQIGARGWLRVPKGRSYLLLSGHRGGQVVAEVGAEDTQRRIAVRAGRYFLRARGRQHMLEGTVDVAVGELVDVEDRLLTRIEYARLVRKGGTALAVVHGPVAGVLYRSALANSDTGCMGALASYIAEYPSLDLGVDLSYCRAGFKTVFVDGTLNEWGLDLRLGRAFDIPVLTLVPNIGIGAGAFHQDFVTEGIASPRTSATARVQAGLGVRMSVAGPVFAEINLGVQVYWFRAGEDGAFQGDVASRSSLGFGVLL